MNNSFFEQEAVELNDEKVDITPILREREAELVNVIGAIQSVRESQDWKVISDKVFKGMTEHLTLEISREARRENPDALKLNRLSGQLKWAERYSDLSKLEDSFRIELTNVRKQYGKTTERPG